jgi:hypothetical protein
MINISVLFVYYLYTHIQNANLIFYLTLSLIEILPIHFQSFMSAFISTYILKSIKSKLNGSIIKEGY